MEKQKRLVGWERETIAASFAFDDKLFMISKNSLKKGIIETFHFTKRTFGVEMITSDLESLNGFEFFAAATVSKDKILITGMCELPIGGTTVLKVFLLTKRQPAEISQNASSGVGILYNLQMIPIQVPSPIEMENYTLSVVGDKAVFHGGLDKEGNIKSTTYILNLTAENPQNNPPPQQGGGGGLFGDGRPPPRQTIFLVQEIQAVPERSPEARFNHCSVALHDSVYIFSGQGLDKKILHDLWKFNLTTRQWARISLSGLDRFGRVGGVATTDQTKIYIAGGSDANGILLNDVLLYDAESDTLQVYKFEPFSDLPHSIFYNLGKIMIARDREIRAASFESEPYLEIKGVSGAGKIQESNLKKFFTEMPFSDITFKVEGQEIPGHKGLLAVRCPHFGRAFSSKMKESFSDVIEIPDMKADVFKGLLEYFYCGKIPKDEKLALELFEVSEMYLLADLRKKCEHFLIQSLRSDNVINLALLAQRFGADKLKNAALCFLSINKQNISDNDFHQLDKDFLIELVKFKK